MLGVTAALWATAGRLFGRRAAFFAAALFAVLGPTLHLGAFATYDAMSLFLVALAAWCVVRAGDRQDATGWMIAAGAALALANAAAYTSALFDIVVLLLALLTAFPKPGGKLAAARSLTMLAVVAVLLTAGTADRRKPLSSTGSSRQRCRGSAVQAPRCPLLAMPGRGLAWSWSAIVRRRHQLDRPATKRADVAAGAAGLRRSAGAA